jgi:hypothetical protein
VNDYLMLGVWLEEEPVLLEIPPVLPERTTDGHWDPDVLGILILLGEVGEPTYLDSQEGFEEVPHLVSVPEGALVPGPGDVLDALHGVRDDGGQEG